SESVSRVGICSSPWAGKNGDGLNREEAIVELRTILQPGSTVYTEIASSDTSSWPRETHIKLYVLKDKEPRSITRMAGYAFGFPMSKSGDAIISLKFLRKA